MSKADKIKEQIGWLKVAFGIVVAVEISIIGWLVGNYEKADMIIVLLAWAILISGAVGIVVINRIAFKKMDELEDL